MTANKRGTHDICARNGRDVAEVYPWFFCCCIEVGGN